jgi:hypothetical protein
VCTSRDCARGYGAVDFVGKVGAMLSSRTKVMNRECLNKLLMQQSRR